MIDFESIHKLFPRLNIENLKEALDAYGITDPDEITAFLAQAAHESCEFKYKVENLNYSADALARVWPSRFATTDKRPNAKALQIARNPQMIANSVYNGRNGNSTDGDDGWKYRGRGYIQLTFKNNYMSVGESLFTVGLLDSPDYLVLYPEMVEQDDYAIYTAVAFWNMSGCRSVYKDFKQLTKKINGGLIGYASRLDMKTKIETALV